MKILVVEDEKKIAEDIATSLAEAGYIVDLCFAGDEALVRGFNDTYDMVILDLCLPVLDGLTVLKRWRAAALKTPIIILTARASWIERVEGINAGADDYLAKPFQMEELLARLQAVRRRASGHATSMMIAGPLRLDMAQRQVVVDGRCIPLTLLEYRLLSHLLQHRGNVISRQELKQHVYGPNDERDVNAIEAIIARMRRKLGTETIETRRGEGYIVSALP